MAARTERRAAQQEAKQQKCPDSVAVRINELQAQYEVSWNAPGKELQKTIEKQAVYSNVSLESSATFCFTKCLDKHRLNVNGLNI